jgi:hypothetical protein
MTVLEMLSRRAIVHPIHHLPQELLEHIFHLLLPPVDEYFAWPRYDAFPLNLAQVCRQWEALILSVRNRRLWSTLWIDHMDPDWKAQFH